MICQRFEDWLERIRRELRRGPISDGQEGRDPWIVHENRLEFMRASRITSQIAGCFYRTMLRHLCVPLTYFSALVGVIESDFGLLYFSSAMTVAVAIALRGTEYMNDSFDDNDPFVRPAVPVEIAYPVAIVDPLSGSRDIDIR